MMFIKKIFIRKSYKLFLSQNFSKKSPNLKFLLGIKIESCFFIPVFKFFFLNIYKNLKQKGSWKIKTDYKHYLSVQNIA